MARAGCRLREVGTTNRTHLEDFAAAIGPKTGAVLKAHASNYAIEGFTAAVTERDLAQLCRARGLPFIVDLGSGTLVDLRRMLATGEIDEAEFNRLKKIVTVQMKGSLLTTPHKEEGP